ncbi:MAG: hypothetical protein AB7O73_00010 [Bacteroidia bacterium]
MKVLFFSLALSLSFGLKSQINYVNGYVVTLEGDTLKGEIKVNPKKDYDKFKRAGFKSKDGAQKNYKPNKIKAYGVEGRNFISWKLDDEDVFLERLTDGHITLLKAAFEAIVMNETNHVYEYYLLIEGEKKLQDINVKKFSKQLTKIMEGSESIAEKYEDGKELNESSAIEVINQFNRTKN